MAKMRFELNRDGVRALLKSAEVEADVRRRAESVARAAGEGHEVLVTKGRNRTGADAFTATYEAMRSEVEDRSLSRSIDAGR